jgi:hypothetical protein
VFQFDTRANLIFVFFGATFFPSDNLIHITGRSWNNLEKTDLKIRKVSFSAEFAS